MEEKQLKQRTIRQNKSIHKGCQQIADYLVENGISLNNAFKNLDIPPTMETIKAMYRSIAKAMYNVDSTSELKTYQVDKVWEVLTKTLSENTGLYFSFPSQETTQNYLESFNQYETN